MRRLSLAVVGANFDNRNGPSRRFEIAICKPGDVVKLIPEPSNPADPRAIAIYSARDVQIGYVRAERAALIGAAIRHGGVSAIFQRAESWGATIRVHLDGTVATLPAISENREAKLAGPDDFDDWPDEVWTDD